MWTIACIITTHDLHTANDRTSNSLSLLLPHVTFLSQCYLSSGTCHIHSLYISTYLSPLQAYVTDGLDLGPKFDPQYVTDHRYQFFMSDMDISVMPTLDYYGFEHEDAITGFVAEFSSQPFNRDGWGGVPLDCTLCIEKDKTTTCLQVRGNCMFAMKFFCVGGIVLCTSSV